MKLIVAGGRNYKLTEKDWDAFLKVYGFHGVTEIVSGGASGVDRCGEAFALKNNVPLKVFPAKWSEHGKAAGPIRNEEMAIYADAVILFKGGRGTQSMFNQAIKHEILIFDCRNL